MHTRSIRTPFGPVEEPLPWLLAAMWTGIFTLGGLGVAVAACWACLEGWIPVDLHDVFNEPY